MKRTFYLIIMLSFFATPASFVRGAEAPQSDKNEVLVDGNPPLTLKLVDEITEFFEWVFEMKLSRERRALFAFRLRITWLAHDQSGIDAFVNARKHFDNLAAESQQRRDQERDRIQAVLLEAYGNEPPETMWGLLISAYKESHAAGKPGNQRPGTLSTAIPSELVGEWIARRGSGSSYQNSQTGQSGPPNATVANYKIFANGTYEHGMLMQSALYNCSTTIFGRETGTVTVTTSTLTLTPRPGTLDYKSTCSPSLNSKKTTNFPRETLSWRLDRDEYCVNLCLQNAMGDSSCFYKQ
jgi:hypothetical protein